jgi:hypothetical protein
MRKMRKLRKLSKMRKMRQVRKIRNMRTVRRYFEFLYIIIICQSPWFEKISASKILKCTRCVK